MISNFHSIKIKKKCQSFFLSHEIILIFFVFCTQYNYFYNNYSTDIFDGRKFKSQSKKSTYKATETVIRQIRKQEGIECYRNKDKVEFLYSKRFKTAVLLKFVAKISKKQFLRRANKKSKHKYDKKKRITTTLCGKLHIDRFLKNPQFKGYTVVTSVGSIAHETCMFFQMENKCNVDAIFFNPNYSDIHDGVEYSKIAHKLALCFGTNLKKVKAYYSTTGNVEGQCSKHVWESIFNLLCNNENPFQKPDIDLQEYTRCFTEKTYNRYFSKKLEYYEIWKNADELLKQNEVNSLDLLNINRDIYKVIAQYFTSK